MKMGKKILFGEVAVESSKILWEVDVNCFKNQDGKEFVSPKFATDCKNETKEEWDLTLHLGGTDSEDKHLLLYLYHYGKYKIKASASFALLNQNNQRVKFWYLKSALFDHKDEWRLSDTVLKEKFVMDPKNNILRNDKFRIWGKIVVEKNAELTAIIESKETTKIKEDEAKTELKANNYTRRLKVLDKFEKLFINKEFSDVTITAEETSFHLHKNILSVGSEVFAAMFQHDMKENNQNAVEIKDIKPYVLQELFRFIYCGKIFKIEKIACELLIAAEKYNIEELKTLCEEEIIEGVDENNAVKCLNLAVENNAERLKKETIQWISFNLESMIEKEELEDFGVKYPKIMFQIMKKHVKISFE